MLNPKRRHSSARCDCRWAHDALARPGVSLCPNCGEVKLPHRAYGNCNQYRGREVTAPKEGF